MHMAPTWCSNWFITSFVLIASSGRSKESMVRKGMTGVPEEQLSSVHKLCTHKDRLLVPIDTAVALAPFLPQYGM